MSSPPDRNRPADAPASAGQLQKRVRRFSREHGIAEKRVRQWIAHMAIGGALARASSGETAYVLRGGVALEMRRQESARATKDLDLTGLAHSAETLVEAMTEALREPYERFTFRRTGRVKKMDEVNTFRVQIGVSFDGQAWTTVTVDISPAEPHLYEIEQIPALDLAGRFGIAGPETLPCLSLRYQLAHKLHAVTTPPTDGRTNDRASDVADILLYGGMVADLPAFRAACVDVFAARARQSWPPEFDPPDAWEADLGTQAAALGLGTLSLTEATEQIRALIASIDDAR